MEEQHPIEGLMVTAMNSIKQMIDVNTIIGDPIQALNNTVIIPISKVGFGFAAGGSEFTDETVNSYNKKEKEENIKYRLPFGGGSGAGVNITPVAFLIVQNNSVRLLEASHASVLDKLVGYIPDAIDKINELFNKKMDSKNYEEEDLEWEDYDNEEDLEWENEENEEVENNENNENNDKKESENNEDNNTKENKNNEEMQEEELLDFDEEEEFVSKGTVEVKENIKNGKKTEKETNFKKILNNKKNNKSKKSEGKIKEIEIELEDDDE